MNKEEILNKYIDLIDKGYCCDCNELNCIDNFPHSKITHAIRELQQENKRLEMINKEYERLNKKNDRGFKITNVQEYNIDELLSYKKYKDKLENQQKEFIDYLENMLDNENDIFSVVRVKDVLSKYKEIIGDVKNENK